MRPKAGLAPALVWGGWQHRLQGSCGSEPGRSDRASLEEDELVRSEEELLALEEDELLTLEREL